MSIQAVAWVLDHSDSRGLARLVLISLANHANTDAECWPAQRTIAREAGISLGAVSVQIKALVESGELEVVSDGGPRTSARYRLSLVHQMNADHVHDVNAASSPGVNAASIAERDRTIREPKKKDLLPTVVDLGERRRDEVWDTLADLFGEPTTETNRKLRGKIVRSLKRAAATEEQIRLRCAAWPHHFDATLTETALEKHWDRLARPPARLPDGAMERWTADQERALRLARAAELDAEAKGLPS